MEELGLYQNFKWSVLICNFGGIATYKMTNEEK